MLTALTSNLGLVVWFSELVKLPLSWFGMFCLLGLVLQVWHERFCLVDLVWYVWFGLEGLVW